MSLLPVRFSTLKHIGRSPAHYKWNLDHPAEPSKAMRLGAAVDAMVFGHRPVEVSECATRRSKQWDAFVANASPDAVLLTPSENELAIGMLESLGRCKAAMDLLSGGERQKTLRWKLGERECSGTPDRFCDEVLVDLKTGVTSDPALVPWQVLKMGYHAQLDWYANAIQCQSGWRPKRCALVFIEQKAPYVVTMFEASEADLLKGQKLWRIWLERLLVCEANDSWPGYCESIVPLNLPDSEGITLQIEGEDVEVQ